MADHPELILTGGPVLTMDTGAPEAEAIAVSDGLIQAVGTARQVLALRGPRTETVDLAGQALLPGFIEAHGHPTTMALVLAPPALDVRPFTEPTGQGVLRRIREAVAAADGDPVLAYGIDLLLQRDLPPLERSLLDEISPYAPLVVLTNSGHAAYTNTAALRTAGITRATPDPSGARYVRDADGEPTGVAHETAAVEPLARVAIGDRLRPDRLAAAMDWAYAEHARAGITTVTDMATLPDLVDALRQAAGRPGAGLRVRSYLIGSADLAKETDQRFAGHTPAAELFGISGIKFWAEGTAWEGSIATSFPYQDNAATRRIGLDRCSHGSTNYTPGELADLVGKFVEGDFPVACHVHGDVTMDAVLDAYERAADGDPERLRRLRPRLEHCGAVTAAQYRRAAGLGATVSLFMDHIRWWGDVLADDLFTPETAENWMAVRSAQDAGHRLSLHNDGACSPTDPLSSVATALTRRTYRSGRVHGTRERLTLDEALRAVTVNPAWQLHLEHEIGMLRPGMRADLAVLSRDPRTADPDRFLEEVAVTTTYFCGRRTWTA